DPLMGRIAVVAETRTDAAHLVGRDRSPDSTPADQHTALYRSRYHRASHVARVVGVVHRIRAVGSQVLHGVAERAECRDQLLLQEQARVVGADGDLHLAPTASGLWATSVRATSTTCSTVNPNFFCSSLSGAEAPKEPIPIMAPVCPTYRSQPKVAACST